MWLWYTYSHLHSAQVCVWVSYRCQNKTTLKKEKRNETENFAAAAAAAEGGGSKKPH